MVCMIIPDLIRGSLGIKGSEKGQMLLRDQELCESRDGRPGLPSLISLQFLWT